MPFPGGVLQWNATFVFIGPTRCTFTLSSPPISIPPFYSISSNHYPILHTNTISRGTLNAPSRSEPLSCCEAWSPSIVIHRQTPPPPTPANLCNVPNHDTFSPKSTSRLIRTPLLHTKTFALATKGSVSWCLARSLVSLPPFPADGSSRSFKPSSNHESITDNRQLACRECSHILRRFSTTWKGPISYRWRG